MKLFYCLFAALGVAILLSNVNGRAAVAGQGATGAPGESGQYCGSIGCHFNGNFDPELSLRLLEQDSTPVMSYRPDEDYIIEIHAEHAGDPAGYGFQLVALRDSDNAGLDGYEDFPAGVRGIQLGDRTYVEHSTILGTNPIYLDWEAPSEGQGDISFYAAINVVNGNGSSSGDGADTTRITLPEENLSSLENPGFTPVVRVYPNPASSWFSIGSDRPYDRAVLRNIQGRQILYIDDHADHEIRVARFERGLYFLELQFPGGEKHIKKLLLH